MRTRGEISARVQKRAVEIRANASRAISGDSIRGGASLRSGLETVADGRVRDVPGDNEAKDGDVGVLEVGDIIFQIVLFFYGDSKGRIDVFGNSDGRVNAVRVRDDVME